jgi:hypothetical protein
VNSSQQGHRRRPGFRDSTSSEASQISAAIRGDRRPAVVTARNSDAPGRKSANRTDSDSRERVEDSTQAGQDDTAAPATTQ